MGARCQVCDGPVVNGRCKLCGMPYRKDGVLYHLNESRSVHYRHATDAAKKEMRVNQTTIPDRKKVTNKNTTAKRVANTAARSAAGKKKEEKKKSRVSWIVPIVILAGTMLPQGIDYIKTQYETNIASRIAREERANAVEVAVTDAAQPIDTEDLVIRAMLDWENITLDVGTSANGHCVEPGRYVLQNISGPSSVRMLDWDTGEEIIYVLDVDGAQVVLELHENDMVWLDSMRNEENYLLLYLIQQYDE